MTTAAKPQRIRDPLHNLVEFGTTQFEHTLWQVIQTRPFQRLRRIRQLGFSELVYPGATHTRFAHSVGVFHTARLLMEIIHRHILESGTHQFKDHQAHVALAAALVHDLGHGMFSHAFETIGSARNLKMAHHEYVSDVLIREGEVSAALNNELGSGFANDVAAVIKQGRPGNLYDAVVSSQFDADRLDYMQRDRLMTGVENSGIDFTWLMANLEIANVKIGVDDKALGEIETFVLGPKALLAAETYVLGLFQLYPTIYFHKATRCAEKIFSELMLRLIPLVRDGHADKTGLPLFHPIVRFAKDPDALGNALALDDTVFWGALPMMAEASDSLISEFAHCLLDRRLPKCVDIRNQIVTAISTKGLTKDDKKRLAERLVTSIQERLKEWSKKNSENAPRILTDKGMRDPYKRFQESKGPLNQMLIRNVDGKIQDVAECSPVIASLEIFELFRAYVPANDNGARKAIDDIVKDELRSV